MTIATEPVPEPTLRKEEIELIKALRVLDDDFQTGIYALIIGELNKAKQTAKGENKKILKDGITALGKMMAEM